MAIPSVLRYAHVLLSGSLRPGDIAIDATAGNGHDTVFLADCVGPSGQVYSFDVQPEALRSTQQRIQEQGLADRVTLVNAGHETMDACLPSTEHGQVGAVAFNLGYLPGGDKSVTTITHTTLRALSVAVELIRPGGTVTAVLYPGHDGGAQETADVLDWANSLDTDRYKAVSYQLLNRPNDPPRLCAIERLGG